MAKEGDDMAMAKRKTSMACLVGILFISAFMAEKAFSAELYPSRPVTVVCGWGAGGMIVLSVRALGKAAEKEMGQPIIVENKAGAAGVIAKTYVAKAKPDGYTLGVSVTSTYTIQPQMRKTSYDPLTDFTDIMAYARYAIGFAVKADASWNTFDEVIAYAKKNPGKFTYAHGGVGSMQHICMEQIALKEGIKWTQVPFKSGPEAVTAALGSHTDGVAQGPADILPHIKAGKLKMLLALNEKRWPEVPNIATVFEKGYDFGVVSYLFIYGPKGIPEPIRQKLEGTLKNGMKDRAFTETLKQFQVEEAYLSGKDYTAKWRSQYDEMGRALKALGLVEQ
jgi:tripartite-type tricarboxylate transporter receptor subunit TctC